MTERSVEVHFKGGPLGGEVRRVALHGSTIRVAVPEYFSVCEVDPSAIPVITTEQEYRIYRGLGFDAVEAVWVNPNERLLQENAKLRRKIEKLEDLEKLLDALQPFLRT